MIYSNLILQKVQQQYLKTDIPNVEVGDTVRLGLLIKEGNKERTQYYEGVTISKKNSGINKTITVRRIMQGIGIERLFLIHSPKIASIEIKKSANVKRSKLYYLRNRSGKATRLKQKY
jgi:large subunit ribosomal protein L19|uniref:Large ribosomal subunit protein bL19c n=1 Tax=Heterosigma akashiwo TaxID=2829 RepID=B2XT92_HETAK|nr:ribosomal protein L19 [Heterosigma akashiwo]ABV65990.1 50S ribosomal protein L19 [Heterosigma akashiwo]BBA18197.1 50S ribosomal protein L1 [Heterosigma akashiwo]BBA18613.1 50S ribosomal protein L1 [Heterosigma akashiwo]BBA18890.1 50S ribosomal protein L1 [Heterosigma akashiwo]BBA19029.1 50S ribosomal protein L1 [Heterosigma akashiwo]|mmetsp:Transcript_37221/g.54549  ORF Transcript_37221/g.54549 Transcript_37221/m.54549 type:complete len:118 (+) Transcript_37221:49-402(+)